MTQANVLAQIGATSGPTFRNRIINGAMVIDQRNAGASKTITDTGAITYTLDRWFAYGSAASKFSVQQNAGSVTPPTGFSNYLGVTSLAATTVASGDLYFIGQYLEGFNTSDLAWGTANAKTVTLSFQVYSSLTGTFGGTLENSATNRSYPFSYTISSANTWTTISVTIAGDTTGTWIGATNGIGIRVFFGLGVGTTYSGTAGSWAGADYRSATGATSVVGTNGATFYITGVQLEVGSSATGFEYRQYQQELALCQRYLPAFGTGNNNLRLPCSGICAGTSSVYITVNFPVTTRVPPTGISISSASHFLVNVDGLISSVPTALAFTATSSTSANRINASGLSGLTTGQPAFLDISNTSGQLLFTGCEL